MYMWGIQVLQFQRCLTSQSQFGGFLSDKYKYILNGIEERNWNVIRTLSNFKVSFAMAQMDAIAAGKKQYFLPLETHGERAGQLQCVLSAGKQIKVPSQQKLGLTTKGHMEEQQGFPAGTAMFMHAPQPVVTSGQITVPSPGERLNGQQLLREQRVCLEVLPSGDQKL